MPTCSGINPDQLPLVVSFPCSLTWPGEDAPHPCPAIYKRRCLAGQPLPGSLASLTFLPPSLVQDSSTPVWFLRVGFQQPLSRGGDGLHHRYLLALQEKPALPLGFHLQTPQSLSFPPHPQPPASSPQPPAPASPLPSLAALGASRKLNVGLKNRIPLKDACLLPYSGL